MVQKKVTWAKLKDQAKKCEDQLVQKGLCCLRSVKLDVFLKRIIMIIIISTDH